MTSQFYEGVTPQRDENQGLGCMKSTRLSKQKFRTYAISRNRKIFFAHPFDLMRVVLRKKSSE